MMLIVSMTMIIKMMMVIMVVMMVMKMVVVTETSCYSRIAPINTVEDRTLHYNFRSKLENTEVIGKG